MVVAKLRAAAESVGVRADSDAGRAFRRTAAALAGAPADSAERRTISANAAIALVHLALADDAAELASLLSPDPASTEVVWTVACYQIGGLIPSALRDFLDPAEAVAVLVACPDEDHVAAELVASTPVGLRWTAMARTNDLVVFNLPDAVTATDASHEHPTELSRALAAWRARLDAWSKGRSEPWDLLDGADQAPTAAWERWPVEEPAPAPPVPEAPSEVRPVERVVEKVVAADATLSAETLDAVGELVRSSVRLASLDLRQMMRDDLAEMGRALRADLAATEARLTCHLDRLLAEVHLQGSLSARPPWQSWAPREERHHRPRQQAQPSPLGYLSGERSPSPTVEEHAGVDVGIVAKSIRAELVLAEARLAAGLSRSWE